MIHVHRVYQLLIIVLTCFRPEIIWKHYKKNYNPEGSQGNFKKVSLFFWNSLFVPFYCIWRQLLHIHTCFVLPGCRNKKLKDGRCPTCNAVPTAENHYYSAVVVIRRQSNSFCQLRIFKDELERLFDFTTAFNDSDECLNALKTRAPRTARGTFSCSGLTVLTAKRPLE